MQVAPRTVWQVSGGPIDRSYADVFLKHGIALIGPGDPGRWGPERGDDEFEGSFVRRFASEVKPGDIVLLRIGQSRVRAIGLIADDYVYLSQFDDVNGWDLQHGRRVRWFKLPQDYDFASQVFGANPPRFSKVATAEVLDYAHRFVTSPPTHWQTAPLPGLPDQEPLLAEIPEALRDLVAQVQDLTGLYWNRHEFGEHPTEDELITHFVVPFLRALGWPVERIAIKWRAIDVIVFRSLPRTPSECHYILEAKRLGQGIEGALAQAQGYLQAIGVQRDIVVTDGIRYRLYQADKDFSPVAYANLSNLKHSALELFTRMKQP